MPMSTFVVPGANQPTVSTPISGTKGGSAERRTNDFSIIVAQLITATPEPPALILALSGGGLLVWSWLRRR
jgi:hypothetical protein